MYESRRKEVIWISWEKHKRTSQLAKALGVPLFTLQRNGKYLIRTCVLAARTVALLLGARPRRVIVQNPSMVLTAVACLLKRPFGYKVIVDRHSAFMCEPRNPVSLLRVAMHRLSRFTIRWADVTIVTNSFLRSLVEKWGGHGFVLQDKFPELERAGPTPMRLLGRRRVVYICSFSKDEPVDEVLEAADKLDGSVVLYITGDYRGYVRRCRIAVPENLIFTGFLPDYEYESLLSGADITMVLTTREHCLVCGAYESMSLGKPVILSNTRCLRDYFGDAPVYTANKAKDIAEAIQYALRHREDLGDRVHVRRKELERAWHIRFNELVGLLGRL